MSNRTLDQNYSRAYDVSQGLIARKVAVGGKKSKVRLGLSPSGRTMFATHESTEQAKVPGRRRTGKSPKPWSKGKYKSICNFRLAGMRRLIGERHAGPCDTHDAETYYMAALPHLVAQNWAYGREEDCIMSVKWAMTWTPDLVIEKGREWFTEQEQRILAEFDNHDGRPSIPSADAFAHELRITHAEVKRHKMLTTGAIDRRQAQRIAEEREADRAYQQSRRLENGAIPREQSMSARRPWEAYGISKSTYKRKVESGEIPPDPVTLRRRAKAATKARPVLRLVS